MTNEVSKLIFQKLDQLEKRIKPEFPNWLNVKQCGAYLGLSTSTIHKLVTSGKIPFRRLPASDYEIKDKLTKRKVKKYPEGGAIRFNRKEIDLFLLNGNVKARKRSRQTFAELL